MNIFITRAALVLMAFYLAAQCPESHCSDATDSQEEEAGPGLLSPRFMPLPETRPAVLPDQKMKDARARVLPVRGPDADMEAEAEAEQSDEPEEETDSEDGTCEEGTMLVPGTDGCKVSYRRCGSACEFGEISGFSRQTETAEHRVTAAGGCVEISYSTRSNFNQCTGQLVDFSVQVMNCTIQNACLPSPGQFQEIMTPGTCDPELSTKINPSVCPGGVQVTGAGQIQVMWENGCDEPQGPETISIDQPQDRSPVSLPGACPAGN